MIFAIEICFVDGEGVDELFDLALCIGAQPREVAGERTRSGGRHPFEHPSLDVVAFRLSEDHSGAPIEEFAKPTEFVFVEGSGFRHGTGGAASGSGRRPSDGKREKRRSAKSLRASAKRGKCRGSAHFRENIDGGSTHIGLVFAGQQRAQQRWLPRARVTCAPARSSGCECPHRGRRSNRGQ